MDLETLLVVFLAISVGAFSKGLTGMGLPLIAVPVMAGFIGVEHAITVITIPNLVSNSWIVWSYRARFQAVPGLFVATLAGALGVVVGTWFLTVSEERMLNIVLATFVGLYLVLMLFKVRIRFGGSWGRFSSPLIAALAGISQGATAMSSAAVAAWVHAFQLEKEAYAFAVSSMFLGLTATHFVLVSAAGLFDQYRIAQGLLALLPIMVFVPLGMRLTRYLSRELFNRLILGLLVVMEVKLVWQGVLGN